MDTSDYIWEMALREVVVETEAFLNYFMHTFTLDMI